MQKQRRTQRKMILISRISRMMMMMTQKMMTHSMMKTIPMMLVQTTMLMSMTTPTTCLIDLDEPVSFSFLPSCASSFPASLPKIRQ
jgi:hypothetical protein